MRGPPAGVHEVELLEQFLRAGAGGRPALAVQAADHHEVLGARQVLVHRGVLAGQADALAQGGGVADGVQARDADRAGVRAQQRGEHADRRRLARAVGAEQAEHRAGLDLEVDAVERADLAERLDEAFDEDGRLAAAAARGGGVTARQGRHGEEGVVGIGGTLRAV